MMDKINGIWVEVAPSKEEVEEVERRRKLYHSDPVLQEMADRIHSNRMMPPPACDQCIQMAMERLKIK